MISRNVEGAVMVTVTLRETTAERLQELANIRGLTLEETLEELVQQAGDPAQKRLESIRLLSELLDIPDTDLAENDERILHEMFGERDDPD